MCHKAKGYIVAGEPLSIGGIDYCGVNTNAWPIGLEFCSELATNICESSYLNLEFPMLIDFNSAVQYYHVCKQMEINTRILFCETLTNQMIKDIPQYENSHICSFLGFDYAYPSGDYYSAIVNDVIYKDKALPTYWKHHLNEFGLLATEDELQQFVKERAIAARENEKSGHGMLFERGKFVGFHVFLVDHSIPHNNRNLHLY